MNIKKPETPISNTPVAAPKPSKSETVKLTNKAGAFANPLAKDAAAWIAGGWYKV